MTKCVLYVYAYAWYVLYHRLVQMSNVYMYRPTSKYQLFHNMLIIWILIFNLECILYYNWKWRMSYSQSKFRSHPACLHTRCVNPILKGIWDILCMWQHDKGLITHLARITQSRHNNIYKLFICFIKHIFNNETHNIFNND